MVYLLLENSSRLKIKEEKMNRCVYVELAEETCYKNVINIEFNTKLSGAEGINFVDLFSPQFVLLHIK